MTKDIFRSACFTSAAFLCTIMLVVASASQQLAAFHPALAVA